jgi:hypothetical protein
MRIATDQYKRVAVAKSKLRRWPSWDETGQNASRLAKSGYGKARRPSLKFHEIAHAQTPWSHRAGKRREISIRWDTADRRKETEPVMKPQRCPWGNSDNYIQYHDTEWAVPIHDDRLLFEFLVLGGHRPD